MKKNKQGFTLIEMLVVLAIIGILLGMTMYFSVDKIREFTDYTAKEKVIATYENVFDNVLLSSYHAGKRYTTLQIRRERGHNTIATQYDSDPWQDMRIPPQATISGLWITGAGVGGPIQTGIVTFKPYTIGCAITDGDGTQYPNQDLLIQMVGRRRTKAFCARIHHSTCAIRQEKCPTTF